MDFIRFCEDAKCPNRHECWNHGTATVMILGNICTRDCRFCSIATGKPQGLDLEEPKRVAEAVKKNEIKARGDNECYTR